MEHQSKSSCMLQEFFVADGGKAKLSSDGSYANVFEKYWTLWH